MDNKPLYVRTKFFKDSGFLYWSTSLHAWCEIGQAAVFTHEEMTSTERTTSDGTSYVYFCPNKGGLAYLPEGEWAELPFTVRLRTREELDAYMEAQ